MTPWRLVFRHLTAHWFRSGLTQLAMVVALFLFCFLVSMVVTLDAAVRQSSASRLMVQSAVSLFVDLPRDYQPRITRVPGVTGVTKFNWFGAYFRDPSDLFAEFAVDHEVFFDLYRRDMRIIAGPDTGLDPRDAALRALAADRRACIIGTGLARDFGWKVGDTVPLTSTIYVKRDGSAWEFHVAGIYEPLKANLDDRTMFFRFDYLAETLDSGQATGPLGAGLFALNVEEGYEAAEVAARIDALFANGPQVTMTTTEAALQASFVAMIGNLPVFLGTIGGAVVFAVFFSVVNTMLMAGRQRLHEAGILKALGFRDRIVGRLLLAESLLLSLGGGSVGIAVAVLTVEPMKRLLGGYFPAYQVAPGTVLAGLGASLLIGLVAGTAPAWMLARLRPAKALRLED